jgi:hypothetical protein
MVILKDAGGPDGTDEVPEYHTVEGTRYTDDTDETGEKG